MPKITQISVQTRNKNRCNLFVDGEFFAGVSTEILLKERIKTGDEVDRATLASLLFESEKQEALGKAVDYISKALKTKKQVKDYLLRKGYSEDIVWFCIDKLKEYAYVDDVEYSKRYINSVSKTNGKKLVEYKLMSKGVKKEDISTAFENTEIDAKENAKAVAEKYLKNKERTKEVKAKAYRYLISRGFSYDEASYALSNFDDNED
ncbi:MAG: hypothetical protein E7340_02975 [Clostridiales bacterium]|nr:hypothetical protein [Clostridiales bacterium]